MKIQLAVYTAVEGYDWQTGSAAFSKSTLNQYKKMIGRFPDPSVDRLPFGGLFTCGNDVVFYRFHIAYKSDSKGRDALYLVLGVCPRTLADKLDFKYLFALKEFSEAMKPYPEETTYIGTTAKPLPSGLSFDASFAKKLDGQASLSMLGTLFATVQGDGLSVKIDGSYVNPVVMVKYAKPLATIPQPGNECANRFGSPDCNATTAYPRQWNNAPQAVLLKQNNVFIFCAVGILAFVLGCVVGYYAHVIKSGNGFKIPGTNMRLDVTTEKQEKENAPLKTTSPRKPVDRALPSTPISKPVKSHGEQDVTIEPCKACFDKGVVDVPEECPFCTGEATIPNGFPCPHHRGTGRLERWIQCPQCQGHKRNQPMPQTAAPKPFAPLGNDSINERLDKNPTETEDADSESNTNGIPDNLKEANSHEQ